MPIAAVPLRDDDYLEYEQDVFSIGYPNNPMKPLTAFGKIKALYALDDGQIIRTSAAFRMGASGGALFDTQGQLIGINTFKSPGRKGNYYSVPVVWVKRLMDAPEISVTARREAPFWDAPEEQCPYFMQVVNAQLTKKWLELQQISQQWINAEATSTEAWYYLGMAENELEHNEQAIAAYKKAITLNAKHSNALYDWGLLALRAGNQAEVERIGIALANIDAEVGDEFKLAVAQPAQ